MCGGGGGGGDDSKPSMSDKLVSNVGFREKDIEGEAISPAARKLESINNNAKSSKSQVIKRSSKKLTNNASANDDKVCTRDFQLITPTNGEIKKYKGNKEAKEKKNKADKKHRIEEKSKMDNASENKNHIVQVQQLFPQ